MESLTKKWTNVMDFEIVPFQKTLLETCRLFFLRLQTETRNAATRAQVIESVYSPLETLLDHEMRRNLYPVS